MNTMVVMRPARTSVALLASGRRGRTKSMVTSVAAELKVLAMEDMIAAKKPAITMPTSPTGSRSKISVGYTRSGLSSCGYSRMAAVPGSTITYSTGSFSRPANSAPQRPWFSSFADSTRWTMNWLVHQK